MITPDELPGLDHDLFRRGGGIGVQGHDALRQIVAGGAGTTQEIAGQIKFKPDAVRRSLKALADSGITERSADGTWSITSTDWDRAARAVGTNGKAERQRRRHQREQEAQRNAVAAWIKSKTHTPTPDSQRPRITDTRRP